MGRTLLDIGAQKQIILFACVIKLVKFRVALRLLFLTKLVRASSFMTVMHLKPCMLLISRYINILRRYVHHRLLSRLPLLGSVSVLPVCLVVLL